MERRAVHKMYQTITEKPSAEMCSPSIPIEGDCRFVHSRTMWKKTSSGTWES